MNQNTLGHVLRRVFATFVLVVSFHLVVFPVAQAHADSLSASAESAAWEAGMMDESLPLVPVVPPAAPRGDPIADAMIDAQTHVNGLLWFGAGCLFGVLGVLAGYVIPPSVPMTSVMGQPPEYVATYTAAYQQAAKKRQGSLALGGCVVWTAVSVVYYAAVMSATY